MNGIIGMIGVLEPELFDSEKREIFDIIKSSSSRLMEVLNDMLSIAKLESGSLKVVHSKFELEPTIKRVTELLSSNTKRKNNELIFNIPDKLYLNSDRLKIEQILINLISNAVKFTDGGKIVINSFTEGSDLIIDVNDNGTGIPQDKQEYIFEMFTQGDESLSRNFEGLGLGLAITKKLIDLLGATIELESAEGLGTTFTVKFPGVISRPENESSLLEPTEVPLKSEKPIAIIEDNFNNRRILVLMLKQLGYQSVEFVNGEDFLTHQNYQDFSYILLDIMLPKMSGEEVYKKIISEGEVLPKTIAMTAHVLERDKEEILAQGFDDFLGKPFRLEDLKQILN